MTRQQPSEAVTGSAGMIEQIKSEVQSFTTNLSGIARNTAKLAPKVLEAYTAYKAENKNSTMLNFCKLFATEKQLLVWPKSDKGAKSPKSKIKALFNSIEYLLRKADIIAKDKVVHQTVIGDALIAARAEAVAQNLEGAELEDFLVAAGNAASNAASVATTHMKTSPEDIAKIILDGWYSNLEDLDVFSAFCVKLLKLKYSDKTAIDIAARASGMIIEEKTKSKVVGFRPAA